MLQKMGIIQALIPASQFVILDEPFAGLDLDGRYYVLQMIEEMKKDGLTVFFSSHILQDVERLCDRLVFLHKGSVVFEDDFLKNSFMEGESRNILYVQNGEKKNLCVKHQEQCQKELKRILSEGGSVLSISPQNSQLEQIYRKLISKK